jgi:type II secretion system protein C
MGNKKNKILFLTFILFFIVNISFAGNNYSNILNSNIFSQQPPAPPPHLTTVTSILKNIPPPVPELNTVLNIIGIMYCSNNNSKVIIQDLKTNKENIYSQGDTVENTTIFKIKKHSVVFLYNNKQIMLSMNNGMPAQNTALAYSAPLNIIHSKTPAINLNHLIAESSPKIMPAKYVNINTALKDLSSDKSLLNTMSLAPQVNANGQVSGFSVNNLPSNSLPVQMGLQNGDVVQSVNGVQINSLATAFQVYNNIMQTHQNVVTVQVLRNNQPVVLTYHLQQ